MAPYAIAVYFLIVLLSVGITVALFFRFRHAVTDLESKVTGIWANEADTIRILIYNLETQYQAEIVWTRDVDPRILGSRIIRNMSLKYFSWGEGTYIDPFTNHHFTFKLKLKDEGHLSFLLYQKSDPTMMKEEEWKLVR